MSNTTPTYLPDTPIILPVYLSGDKEIVPPCTALPDEELLFELLVCKICLTSLIILSLREFSSIGFVLSLDILSSIFEYAMTASTAVPAILNPGIDNKNPQYGLYPNLSKIFICPINVTIQKAN